MDGLTELSGKHRSLRFLSGLAVLLLLCSCSLEPVLIVSDTSLEIMQGRKWILHRMWFRIQSAAAGYRVIQETGNSERPLEEILKENNNYTGTVVVSPFIAHITNSLENPPKRLIVAGGPAPLNSSLEWEAVYPCMDKALAQAAALACGYAEDSERGSVLVLFKDPEEEASLHNFQDAFNEKSGETISLDKMFITNIASESFPDAFSEQASAADLMVLLAGESNLQALNTDAGRELPVIGEFMGNPKNWPDNVMASVENDAYAMSKTLLFCLKNPENEQNMPYYARLRVIKAWKVKKWFDAILLQTYN